MILLNKDLISRFKYVRIQGQELAENTMYAKGIFSMCWDLIQNDTMDEEDKALYEEIDDWFAHTLPGEIVYEDQYQVAVQVSGKLDIKPIPKSWSPEQ